MNLTYTRPGELRKPDVEVLPDGRIRITRYIAAGHGDRDYSEVTESVGTADKGLATALLVKRGMAQINGKDAIVKTYEVRNASSETLVGQADVQYTESGQKTMVYDYIQMSSGTYTPGTIGSTQAPGDATCILRTEQTEDDGTTRQIRRVFINKGLLQQSDETRNNGALLLKTFVYLNDAPVPNPPPNYTLISQRTENPNGLETTTYTYAYGTGEISREDSTSNNGALLRATIRHLSPPGIVVNPISTPGGYTLVDESYQDADGHKIWTAVYVQGTGEISSDENISNNGALSKITIRHLSTPAVVVNPIAAPAAGYILIDSSYQDNDGHKVWTAVYAKGDGEISRDDNTSNNGALLRATIRYLSDPSVTSNPITITGGYTLIDVSYQDSDGHKIWTGIYAKGVGEISRDIAYSNTSSPGTTGITRTTIRYLVAPAATVQPTTEAGSVEIARSLQEADGHRIWTTVWAKGSGEISRDIRYVQSLDKGVTNGATVITIRHLTAISVNVNPTSEPTYVMVSEDKSDQDGYRVWTVVYAKGTGTVVTDVDIRNNGKLKIYHRIGLGAAPTTPTSDPSIGGTVVLISQNERNDNGYVIYDYTWAEGKGTVNYSYDIRISGCLAVHQTTSLAVVPPNPSLVISGTLVNVSRRQRQDSGLIIYDYEWVEVVTSTVSLTTRAREDGSLVYGISVSSTTQSTPAYPGTGTGYLVDDSYERNNGYYINKATYIKAPDSYDFPKQISYTIPGLAVAANPPTYDPPISKNLMATAYVTYSTTKTTDVPYKVDNYAQLRINYKRKDDQKQYSTVKSLDGYVGNSSFVGSNITFAGVDVESVAVTVTGASPTAKPSGITILAVDCEKYLTTTSGTTVWRNVSVKYTF